VQGLLNTVVELIAGIVEVVSSSMYDSRGFAPDFENIELQSIGDFLRSVQSLQQVLKIYNKIIR
jgi:hypothetical protein